MPRVKFLDHVIGVPNGGGPSHTYNKGTVADLTDDEYYCLYYRRDRAGNPWIRKAEGEPLVTVPLNRKTVVQKAKEAAELRLVPKPCPECGGLFNSKQMGGHRSGHTRNRWKRNGVPMKHNGAAVDARLDLDVLRS